MKSLPAALQAHVSTGVTTLAWCWRLTRRDGTQMGFTDHDRDLAFEGTVFEAGSGFTATEIKESVGLGVDDLEVESGLISGRLDEEGLGSGLFDDAKVEIWRVNWADTTQRVLVRVGSIGEVRRTGTAFRAEIRGLSHYLQQPKGRLFQYTCDTDLGSPRCRIDLGSPSYSAISSIGSISSETVVTVPGLGGYLDGWFANGLFELQSGSAAGFRSEIRSDVRSSGEGIVTVWALLPPSIAVGDTVRLIAGCDKHLDTCRVKFANAVNYQGFPFMPGNAFVTAYAAPGRVPKA